MTRRKIPWAIAFANPDVLEQAYLEFNSDYLLPFKAVRDAGGFKMRWITTLYVLKKYGPTEGNEFSYKELIETRISSLIKEKRFRKPSDIHLRSLRGWDAIELSHINRVVYSGFPREIQIINFLGQQPEYRSDPTKLIPGLGSSSLHELYSTNRLFGEKVKEAKEAERLRAKRRREIDLL